MMSQLDNFETTEELDRTTRMCALPVNLPIPLDKAWDRTATF